jgi:C1A family cysteine protease
MRELGVSYELSPEQITQCTTRGSSGCDGGATEAAYRYVEGVKGVVTAEAYPYTDSTYQGVTGICQADTSKAVIAVKDFFWILAGESSMASFVQQTGPLSVCLDATTWNTYKGGVMSHCGSRVNHCVQAVGVDAGANGYWKVRNSWGIEWGEEGFIRLAYGQDTCAISNDPTYTLVTKTL